MRHLFFVLVLLIVGAVVNGQTIKIDGDTPWVISEADYENIPIQKAIRDAERDWYKVFGYPPVIFKNKPASSWDGPVVVLGSAQNTKELLESQVPGGNEQYHISVDKVAGGNKAVLAVGSDTRGTIYAIYTFCEEVLGIDPMYIFTDHKPTKQTEIVLNADFDIRSKKPTFEYRGWFINDEELHDGMHRDPLGGNVISMEWMDKILETLLRCKCNMIAPESAPYSDATVYELCKRRDVVITFHHILPVGLNMMDWPQGVPFSYITHKDILEDAWRKSAKVLADKKVAWTIGFRGESDGAFWNSDPAAPTDDQGRANVISEAMHKQVEIIREVDPDATIIAALWNELGEFYNKGILKVPAGVCKMFVDDGRGFMRDKGDGSDLDPGDGLYYHVMMQMLTQNRTTEAVPPARIYSELKRYVDRGATKYAIINVSGIRPAAMSVEAISDFMWDAESVLNKAPEEAMEEYLLDWYAKEFSPELAQTLTDLRLKYYDIPYMRDKMPVQGRWRGARAEHLLLFLTQSLLQNITLALDEGKSLDDVKEQLEAGRRYISLDMAREPLAGNAEFFPELWDETLACAKEIPQERQDYYQFHFTYQVAVHMYSSKMLTIVCDAYEAFEKNNDARAFALQMEEALGLMERIIAEAHRAEYGIWDTMFMHVRLMDLFKTRLMLKATIAKINNQPFTNESRGYWGGSFWGAAQEYMQHGDGTFPYFYKNSGSGLNVLEEKNQ
ncbi:glycosyl hydrolase 115 family protein [Mangrovibacterium sp.]|uniref:glycosyl hydrolase 115 family protein n=1 Tax=Mangrovibacterium sp. TaxID=1961364 RepID=UPI0035623716